MPTYEELQALAKLAAERSATEVEIWYAMKQGDRIVGQQVEHGFVETDFGVSATSTLQVLGDDYVLDGKKIKVGTNKQLVRVAWMGAVLSAEHDRMQPEDGDIVAMHFQKTVTPKTAGYKDYDLTVATVLDQHTGLLKTGAIPLPENGEVPANIDSNTGEIKTGVSPLEPREGETSF